MVTWIEIFFTKYTLRSFVIQFFSPCRWLNIYMHWFCCMFFFDLISTCRKYVRETCNIQWNGRSIVRNASPFFVVSSHNIVEMLQETPLSPYSPEVRFLFDFFFYIVYKIQCNVGDKSNSTVGQFVTKIVQNCTYSLTKNF